MDAGGQFGQAGGRGLDPFAVGVLGGEAVLDLRIGDDASGLDIDEEHPARSQSSAGGDLGFRQVDDSGFAGEDDGVLGHDVPGRTQSVAVEHGSGEAAVGEGDAGRSVPGLHEQRVVFVEGPPLLGHGRVVLPGFGDHHQHGLRQRPAGGDHELEDRVE